MNNKQAGMTLLEIVLAVALTMVFLLGMNAMMSGMQKASRFSRDGDVFTEQVMPVLQEMEKNLRYALVEKSVPCVTASVTTKVDSPSYLSGGVAGGVFIKNPDMETVRYRCVMNTATSLYRIERTRKKINGAACDALETSVKITGDIFSACQFAVDGNTIKIALQGQRSNPLGVKTLTDKVTKTIYLTDFQEV